MRILLIVILSSLANDAFSQNVSLGVIGGTNLTDDVRSGRQTFPGGTLPSGQTQTTTFIVDPGVRRPIVGVQFDYRISRDWSVEFDALHRELKSTTTSLISPPIELPGGRTLSSLGPSTGTLTTWEFPLLAKYRLPLRRLHPFLTGGPSFRPAGSGSGLSHAGITVGGGLEFRTGAGFRISPALRYTRWSYRPIGYTLGAPLQNQVEFLVGLDRSPASKRVSAFGLPFSLGVMAGIGLGQDFRVGTFEQALRPERESGIFGVMIAVPVRSYFAIEIDGLYRPLHGTGLEFGRRVRFAHLTWEFPVLLKRRLPGRWRLEPFIEGGPSFRAEGNLNLSPVSHVGGTVGAGIETRWWRGPRLRISPRGRYTRWPGEGNSAFSRVSANQVHLLVSFSF